MLRRLKAAWFYLKFAPYIETADAEEFWTEEDANNLARFFSGYTGKKLKIRLTNYVTKAATEAVQKQGDYAHNSGVAFGISLGVNAISEHFPLQQGVSAEPEQDEAMTALDALANEAAL
jgi:hypothetical protein